MPTVFQTQKNLIKSSLNNLQQFKQIIPTVIINVQRKEKKTAFLCTIGYESYLFLQKIHSSLGLFKFASCKQCSLSNEWKLFLQSKNLRKNGRRKSFVD